jgi:hypothetical protein
MWWIRTCKGMVLWGCILASCWGGFIAEAAFVPGTTNYIHADGTTGSSYILYLPTSYDSNSPPPLVLYFDPGADSGYGMGKLQPSCEAAGWLLACANDLQNGWVENEELVIREIMDDVRNRIPYDRSRFYLSGLSGGSWRANTASREYWNEVTGLLLFACWIGDYDDYTLFPDRLAVTRINGLDDISIRQEMDLVYYTQTLVRVHDVFFDGGHEIGPSDAIDEAVTWLEDDYSTIGQFYIPADFEAAASSLVNSAQSAWNGTNINLVVSNAMAVMQQYPMSSSVREAERLLFLVFTNELLRAQVEYNPLPSEAWPTSWMLMQRGLGTEDNFPSYFAQAYFEAAIRACPTNSRALGENAYQILMDADRNRQEWPLAADLAETAFLLKTNHWRALHVQSVLAAQMGDMRGALFYLQQAMDRMPGDTGNDALSNTYDDFEDLVIRYERELEQIQPLPLLEGFERLPMNRSAEGRNGWALPWGEANNQTQTVHNGLCALSITGQQSMAFLNCALRTNENLWIDCYMQPARSGADYIHPLPPLSTALFYVQHNGYLRVYDGAGSHWVTLSHTPIPADDWSRISIHIDFSAQEWSIFLNDQEVGSTLGLAQSNSVFSGIYFLHDSEDPTVLDDLTITGNAPLADRDLDGLPDVWEVAYALDPDDPSDSGLDPDGDLYANDEEFRQGTSPGEWNEPPTNTFAAEVEVDAAGFSLGEMVRTNMLYRHHRWNGEVLLATSNQASIYFKTYSSSGTVCWGEIDADPVALSTTGVVINVGSDAGSDEKLTIPGPLNALYSVLFDESTGEFRVEWSGFHDADGDTMMDEWEMLHTGTSTGLTPYGNPDADAFPTIEEYFRNTDPQSHDPYSGFPSISLAGSFNGWRTTSFNMTRVGDHVWQYRYWWGPGASSFKFVANHSWDVNWGDNQQAATDVPFRDTSDQQGANIVMSVTNSGYDGTISFNDLTRKYAIVSRAQDEDMDGMPDDWEVARYTNRWMYGASSDSDEDGWVNIAEYLQDTDPLVPDTGMVTNISLSVVGNFSGWNTASHFMQPAGNHLWQLDMTFTNLTDAQFKFVANGTWDTAWGSPSAESFPLPLQALGNAQGGSPNFTSSEPLDGCYRFTFNEAAGLCALDYAPDYIVCTPPRWVEGATNRTMVLEWLSSSYQQYYLLCYTNLLADPILLDAFIPATPPINVTTQMLDSEMRMGIFQIRLVD